MSESQPLLLSSEDRDEPALVTINDTPTVEPSNKDKDEKASNSGDSAATKEEKKAVDLVARRRVAKRGIFVNVAAAILWVVAGAAAHQAMIPYHTHLSCFDVLVADFLRCLTVLVALVVGGPPYDPDVEEKGKGGKNHATGEVITGDEMSEEEKEAQKKRKQKIVFHNRVFLIGHYLNFLFLFIISAKLWVFRQWSNLGGSEDYSSDAGEKIPTALYDQGAAIVNTAILILSLGLTIGSAFLTNEISTIDTPNKTALRLKSMWVILKPYFAPKGFVNKICVVIVWTFVIGGKAANIIAPIYLGRAVNKLTQIASLSPHVATTNAMVDGSGFVSSNSSSLIISEGGPIDSSTSQRSSLADAAYNDIYIYCFLLFFPKVSSEVEDVLYVKVWQAAFVESAEVTFRHLHSLSLDWHLRKKMGNALRSMDRGLMAADTLMSGFMMRVFPVVGSALAAFLVFTLHFEKPEIAGICYIALAMYMWLTYVITVWRTKFNEEMNTHDNDMHEKATDSLINFETVKYFTNEEFETSRYVKCVTDYQRLSYVSQWATSIVNLAQNGTIQACMLFALLVSAHAIVHNEAGFSVGEFVAIQAYVVTIFAPLSYLGMIYSWMIDALVDMQNLSDLLAERADIVDSKDAKPSKLLALTHNGGSKMNSPTKHQQQNLQATVKFSNIRFKYPSQDDTQGLHDINFTVPAGTTTAIVGQTGSGKTTLSRLLFRFYEPNSGKIEVGGEDIAHMTQQSLRQVIGVVPQDTCMFNDSIEFNVKYGRTDATMADVNAAAAAAHIKDFIEKLPDGWQSQVGERGLKLSGGEKQRVAIARCLLKNPPIVLLDEATSALDNKTERDVQLALQSLRGRTTLVIAHRLTTVRNADQIIVMKAGRIIEKGRHQELLDRPGSEYAAMWSAQQDALKQGEGAAADSEVEAVATSE